jgi:hypothetical protein
MARLRRYHFRSGSTAFRQGLGQTVNQTAERLTHRRYRDPRPGCQHPVETSHVFAMTVPVERAGYESDSLNSGISLSRCEFSHNRHFYHVGSTQAADPTTERVGRVSTHPPRCSVCCPIRFVAYARRDLYCKAHKQFAERLGCSSPVGRYFLNPLRSVLPSRKA